MATASILAGLEVADSGSVLYRDEDRAIVEAVLTLAGDRGVAPAQIGLAWLAANPVVTAPIVGATKIEHIDDAVASLDITLTRDEVRLLEDAYVPHPVAGHWSPKTGRARGTE